MHFIPEEVGIFGIRHRETRLRVVAEWGVAWSSSQRRSLSLQESRDQIPVFLSFDQRFRFFVYSIVIRSINTFHVANDERHARRDEEEKPAGVSGMDARKEYFRFVSKSG